MRIGDVYGGIRAETDRLLRRARDSAVLVRRCVSQTHNEALMASTTVHNRRSSSLDHVRRCRKCVDRLSTEFEN